MRRRTGTAAGLLDEDVVEVLTVVHRVDLDILVRDLESVEELLGANTVPRRYVSACVATGATYGQEVRPNIMTLLSLMSLSNSATAALFRASIVVLVANERVWEVWRGAGARSGWG